MSIGQRVRYIGPKQDRHGIEIPYTFGTVAEEEDGGVLVKLDDNAYAQSWGGTVGSFGRCWSPIRYVAKVELYNRCRGSEVIGNGYAVARFLPDNTRLHRIHDFIDDDEAARACAAKLNNDPSFQVYLPIGYPCRENHCRARDFEQHEFVRLGYSNAESWTLYYSQRARAVDDPLSPCAQVIRAKLVNPVGHPAGRLTPREQAWIEERTALRADPSIRLLMDIADEAGSSKEAEQAKIAASKLGQTVLREAWIIP